MSILERCPGWTIPDVLALTVLQMHELCEEWSERDAKAGGT